MDNSRYSNYRPSASQLLCLAIAMIMGATLLGCGTTPTKPKPKSVVIAGGQSVPEPVPADANQVIDFEAYNAVREIAANEGTLAARGHRNALLIRGLDTTTTALIDSHIAWLEGDIPESQARLKAAVTTDLDARLFILGEQQKRLEIQGNWLAAARLAHRQLRLSGIANQARSDALWSALMHLSDNQLVSAIAAADGGDWRAWLALNQAYRKGRSAVNQWLGAHGDHSAIDSMPAALGTWLDSTAPKTVAVLLPLSGRLEEAGGAVLQGIIETFYQAFPDTQQRPRLMTIDTTSFSDVISAYRDAIRRDAELVIGPLTKADAQAIGSLRERPVPVIALNRPEALPPSKAANWHALSLAPEDEARQIARMAFGRGQRRALMIRPDSDWGRRMEAALTQSWRQLGGELVNTLALSSELTESEQVSAAVGAGDSERRIGAIEQAFEAPVEARARRRQDFDAVFLLAPSPVEARSLRPLLIYHYSGDVPIYASSAASSGHRHLQNRDLNDLTLVETPAVLEAIDVDRYTRLTALGADAVRMIHHRTQAESTTAPFLRAQTGILHRRTNGEIERELIPVIYDGDELRPLTLP